ncbi:glycosyltransferase [Ferribacterium limneticum]|uniref:glycosyltransferase n=1 Tax=Ferribacterium limneticum TaxID=76259 RepID=UPI001CF7EFA9|nr:glycosyltransferase [Ferribacterium limneticum]UCV24739.1 glycosyltransferase [Ferribacterium limneticum]
MAGSAHPHIVVLSSLFPSQIQPGAGLFIRERMFRVGKHLPLSVVSPTPWFPLQSLIQKLKPYFRPGAPKHERQSGIDVWFPHFLSVPGLLKGWDGMMMAIGALPRMRHLKRCGKLDIIDTHFAYPDGYAACLLSRWLGVPYTLTLRGTESRHLQTPSLRTKALQAIKCASQVFSVSDSLKKLAVEHGADASKIEVVGNGVDIERFSRIERRAARTAIGIPSGVPILISVGGLVRRKGFHRVIEILPKLRIQFPELMYLIVGGPSPEGNNRKQLEQQIETLGLRECVRFMGAVKPDDLPPLLSAADVFVLATSNEGWANVLLEAMACGLPVVTTDVGGNREVVSDETLGIITPFGDQNALEEAICQALNMIWDGDHIRQYAQKNSWDERVERLCAHFSSIAPVRENKQ